MTGRRLLLAAILLFTWGKDARASAFQTDGDLSPGKARNIILLIGDGMGITQRQAARWSSAGLNGTLNMDQMPVSGWSQTASADNPITDSAASATAMATGVKTKNGVIGMDQNLIAITTILEYAQAQGMAVGLVTNVPLTHATPAAFAAHVPQRSMTAEIAEQLLETGVEVLLGGGENDFLPPTATGCYPNPGTRQDDRHLISEAIVAGYTYVCDAQGLAGIDPAGTPRLLGIFSDGGMPRPYEPPLSDLTRTALELLSQDPQGFFLMIEGGQIDWASHANDAANTIADTIGFDQAVAVAMSYAEGASDTLVIVAADHETGGMRVSLTSSGLPSEDGPFWTPGGIPFYVNWTTSSHTPADVPVTTRGPWSEQLSGHYENTHIFYTMLAALSVNHLWVDDFASETLDSAWSWLREDADRWSLNAQPGSLRIMMDQGSLLGPGGDAHNLLLQPAPPGNYQIRTQILISPTTDLVHAGLLAYQDDENYIYLSRGICNACPENGVYYISEENGLTTLISTTINITNTYLMLQKVGFTYAAAYSIDGNSWHTLGKHTLSLASTTRVGLLASSGDTGVTSEVAIADFDDFQLYAIQHRLYLPMSFQGW